MDEAKSWLMKMKHLIFLVSNQCTILLKCSCHPWRNQDKDQNGSSLKNVDSFFGANKPRILLKQSKSNILLSDKEDTNYNK